MKFCGLGVMVLFLSGVTTGCEVDEVSLQGKQCPCAPGWECDVPTQVCLRAERVSAPDASADGEDGSLPVGPDAGRFDGGGMVDADGGLVPRDGGAPPDAGRDEPDAGVGVDAGPAPSGCFDEHADALFCDGFEEATVWRVQRTTDGSAKRSTGQAYRGSYAFRAATNAASGVAYWAEPALTGLEEFWVRAWIFVDDVGTDGLTPLMLSETGSPNHISFTRTDSSTSVLYSNASGDQWSELGDNPPLRTWFCVEIHVQVDDTDGVAEFWIDDVLQGRHTGADTRPDRGSYDDLRIGIPYSSSEQTGATVYLDEVVLDDARIGCD